MKIRILDSHTGGEPTRVILDGGPELGTGSLAARLARLRADHDPFRLAVIGEPRFSGVGVGALLCEPDDASCTAGVIYFEKGCYMGMCGHGTIGLVTTLAHLGRIGPGLHRIETPVGVVAAELHADGQVTVANVPSYRTAAGVSVEVPGHGTVKGDVAWGGNWFFVIREHGLELSSDNLDELADFASRVGQALPAAGVDPQVNAVALFGPSPVPGLDSRNFVLCPGKVYDRSPCGTGTSAMLACLHADGRVQPGRIWRQESIVGSVFEMSYTVEAARPERIVPRITGAAYITGETILHLDERDPFRWGIPYSSGLL